MVPLTRTPPNPMANPIARNWPSASPHAGTPTGGRWRLGTFVSGLLAAGALLLAPPAQAALSPTASLATCDDLASNYVQIQEQLHATQVVLQDKLAAARKAGESNTAALDLRLKSLEQMKHTLAQNLARRPMVMAEPERKTGWSPGWGGGFGLLGLGALLLGLLQWFLRPPPTASPAPAAADADAAIEAATARLMEVINHLDQRIKELEARPLPPEPSAPLPASAASPEYPGNQPMEITVPDMKPADLLAADLLAEGEKLLAADLPLPALECFDQFLATQPAHAEALIQRAAALEKMGRSDEALAGYDQALAMDASLAVVHLRKGSLLNQLQRYDEAVNCFEQALVCQDAQAKPVTRAPQGESDSLVA